MGTDFFVLLPPLLALCAVVGFMIFFVAGLFRSPFVPSSGRTVDKMIRAAKIQPGERVIDLGCGDGRILFAAERAGATATGYEISLLVWCLAQLNRLLRRSRVNIRRQSLWTADLRQADVVCCYLLPRVMAQLRDKFDIELKPGARVVSASFVLPGWKPELVLPEDADGKKVMVYRKI